MHTYVGTSCRIIHNSDLSGETIIKNGEDEVSIDLSDIANFLIHQAFDRGNSGPFDHVIEHSHVTAITLEATLGDGPIKRFKTLTIRGDQNGKIE